MINGPQVEWDIVYGWHYSPTNIPVEEVTSTELLRQARKPEEVGATHCEHGVVHTEKCPICRTYTASELAEKVREAKALAYERCAKEMGVIHRILFNKWAAATRAGKE